MSTNLELPTLTELKPRIVVIGVGGAGGNAINNMIASGLDGVEYVAANTDAQALVSSSAERRIQLGVNLTEGLGAGSKPEIGEAAAEEAIEEIRTQVAGAHMVFIAAGMGGGTGTGAAAVIARAARELGILTVGIVTKPFQFEGSRRMRIADAGIAELKKYVDTLIVIPNQNLFRIATEKTTFAEAFVLADQVLYSGVACIVDLIIKDGLINLDFADVRTVMTGMGTAMMGTGEATGERRAQRAAEEAISNPLLDEVTLKGAKGVLLSIIGGSDMTLYEVDEAASRVREEVDPEANIIVGAAFDDSLNDSIRVAIVASGLVGGEMGHRPPAIPGDLPAKAPPLPSQYVAGWDVPPQATAPRTTPPPTPQPPMAPPALPPSFQEPGMPPSVRYTQTHQAAEGPRGSLQPPVQPGDSPRELWRGPGNVVIEETRPIRSDVASPKHPAPPREALAQEAPRFEPAAPEEVRRPASRRVPNLDEFPPVGQREFRAKSAQYDSVTPPDDRMSQHRAKVADPQPRGGLLQRMIGSARKSIRQ
ncbi:MAG: cell division protein FtsZ [Hyphomicrobiaceae bacterium]